MNKTIFFIIALFFFSLGTVKANTLPDANTLFRHMENRNLQLENFIADLSLSIKSGYLSFPVNGQAYFQRPNKVRLKFDFLPDFLLNQQIFLQKAMPVGNNYSQSRMETLCTDQKFGTNYYIVKIIPEQKQNLKETWVWISMTKNEPEIFYLSYRDGGHIEIKNTFLSHKFMLVKKQEIYFALPEIKSTVTIAYKNYRINSKNFID